MCAVNTYLHTCIGMRTPVCKDGMVWPLIVNGNTIRFGNKRLLYAKVNGYDLVDCIFEIAKDNTRFISDVI